MASAPRRDRQLAWSYYNAINLASGTGFRKARLRTRFDKRVETGAAREPSEDGLVDLTDVGYSEIRDGDTESTSRDNDAKPAYPAGKPPTPAEMREMGPHAPLRGGVRICRGRSLWEGCSKESKRSLAHRMISLANLRSLFKAPLARRGRRMG